MTPARRAHVHALTERPVGYAGGESARMGAVMQSACLSIGPRGCAESHLILSLSASIVDVDCRLRTSRILPPETAASFPAHPLAASPETRCRVGCKQKVSIGPQTCASSPACSLKLHQLSFAGRFCDLVGNEQGGRKKRGQERKWLLCNIQTTGVDQHQRIVSSASPNTTPGTPFTWFFFLSSLFFLFGASRLAWAKSPRPAREASRLRLGRRNGQQSQTRRERGHLGFYRQFWILGWA
ncbi:hypothetical protein J3E69DRAFT_305786 [Trichoderma sp. SZMC 28015]